ncbi:hypothetical protein [Falsiroseomonas oryziterrae]|uniref:hypothetical protein n=1 Tax=Falsiroseomonas oryziterrae TaxID=2911368 RepID=UPI001F31CD0B|nr:hypothetical protein [Roseomonas sp. NPKOSM-4]
MRRRSRPAAPRRAIAHLTGLMLALLAVSGCAQRTPPAERPYWRVEPRAPNELPRLPSPADAFRA